MFFVVYEKKKTEIFDAGKKDWVYWGLTNLLTDCLYFKKNINFFVNFVYKRLLILFFYIAKKGINNKLNCYWETTQIEKETALKFVKKQENGPKT